MEENGSRQLAKRMAVLWDGEAPWLSKELDTKKFDANCSGSPVAPTSSTRTLHGRTQFTNTFATEALRSKTGEPCASSDVSLILMRRQSIQIRFAMDLNMPFCRYLTPCPVGCLIATDELLIVFCP